jgi:GT2 family glycosyltransferase
MKAPSVSAIIVNWNHDHLIQGCLDALLAQGYEPLDITVVDNGSHDGSPERIADYFPDVRLKVFSKNLGFSHALNWGVRHSAGDWILSLNPDTVMQDQCIREMLQVVDACSEQSSRVGSVAPKLLQAAAPTLLDSTGLFVDRRRCPFDRGQGESDRRQYDQCLEVFGACGAAALYRRAMLEDVAPDGDYFDTGFFAYYEDADLAWRAQLRGWRCLYAPRAVMTHDRGRGDTLLKPGREAKNTAGPRLALRNRYLMTVKNDLRRHFFSDLPWILAAELPRLGYAAVTKPAVLLGLLDLVRALPRARRQRRQIQDQRVVDGDAIRRWFVEPGVADSLE